MLLFIIGFLEGAGKEESHGSASSKSSRGSLQSPTFFFNQLPVCPNSPFPIFVSMSLPVTLFLSPFLLSLPLFLFVQPHVDPSLLTTSR